MARRKQTRDTNERLSPPRGQGMSISTLTQTIESDRSYLAFAAILDELGIPCEKLPYESYLNPVVELPPEQR